jgi:nicotinic acid mononucleotide adenylyltransferase
MGFKKYIKDLDSQKTMVFTFGRFNPFTKGHQMLWDAVTKEGRKRRADSCIYTSWSHNSKKNPLSPKDKIFYMRKVVDRKTRVSDDDSLRNTQQIAKDLIAKGYTKIVLVVGADRLSDFDAMKKQVQEFSDGNTVIEIVSFSGKTRIGNYSGTRMRNFAKDDDFEGFYNALPDKISKTDAKEMFEKVQIGLGV